MKKGSDYDTIHSAAVARHDGGVDAAAGTFARRCLALIILLVTPAWAVADGVTPEDIARLNYVGSAMMSPDGSAIAYSVAYPRDPYYEPAEYEAKFKDGTAQTELRIYDIAAESSRIFLSRETSFGGVSWTPDGRALSFTAKRGDDEHSSLYLLPVNGGEARKIVAHETAIGGYSMSPDGARVAFIATPEEDKAKEKLKKKGFKADVFEEGLRKSQLWIASVADGMNKHRLIELDGHVLSVAWSPAGDRLAVRRSPQPLIDDQYMKSETILVDPDSGAVTMQIQTVGKLGDGHWSPDGKHLAMIGVVDIHDPAEGRILVASVDDPNPTELMVDYPGHVQDIGWQGNDTLMFLGHEGCESVFGEIKIDGSDMKRIVANGTPILLSMGLSKDGMHAAFVADAPTYYRELFVMKHGDAAPKRLTNTNPWLAERDLGKQDVVRYSARDGLEIEGVLIRPVNEQPDTRYPLIVVVHGGPEAHQSNGWLTAYSRPGQMAAAKGYAVFYPNYRGGTGRGVEFSMASQGRYGKEEFDDVVDGVRHLVSIGLVDEKRVGITGGSYGGYASAWGATKLTDVYAASVMFVGISEQISKFGTTDIPNEMHLVHSRCWPWEKWDLYRESSPVSYVEQARTPILIMHGAEDTRVHPTQSMTLYRYLKTYGKVPVRLVLYPGEGHGNRKAGARLDYCLRMMRWFDHYLKEGDQRSAAPPEMDVDYGLPDGKKDKADEKNGEDAS